MLQPSVAPMAVGRKDGGVLARLAQGPVKVAAQVVAGQGLDQHFFDGVAGALQPAEDLGL